MSALGRRRVVAVLALVLAVCACGGDDDSERRRSRTARATVDHPAESTTGSGGDGHHRAAAPVARRRRGDRHRGGRGREPDRARRPGRAPTTLYVAERGGPRPALDVGDEGRQRSATTRCSTCRRRRRTGGERGLLGIAFSADGDTLYVSYTEPRRRHPASTSTRWTATGPTPGRRRELLAVDQPFANHNGGNVVLRPRRLPLLRPRRRRRRRRPRRPRPGPDDLLGKLLRIDPLRATPYASRTTRSRRRRPPRSGPSGCATRGGSPSTAATDDLWIADVGQDAIEEIDLLPGRHPGRRTSAGAATRAARSTTRAGSPRHVPPVFECATTTAGAR